MIYKFEIDDIKFCERADPSLCQRTMKELLVFRNKKERKSEGYKLLEKGWSMLLADMEFAQKDVEGLCGTAFASLPQDYGGELVILRMK